MARTGLWPTSPTDAKRAEIFQLTNAGFRQPMTRVAEPPQPPLDGPNHLFLSLKRSQE
jgi:hypothetical protein